VLPKLILINGVPASGKTTLARSWCDRHGEQLPLCLDVDSIRAMLGGWRYALHDAGLAARDIAIAGIEAHLLSGRDVVVPQYLRRAEFIDRLAATAARRDGLFVETALSVDAAIAQARFLARAESVADADPHGALPIRMADVVSEFEDFMTSRPRAVRIPSGEGALVSLEAAIAEAEATRG